jgi:propionyl-CoA carboxylase beta chain
MFVTGPNVVKTVTNEDVTQEQLVRRRGAMPFRYQESVRACMSDRRCSSNAPPAHGHSPQGGAKTHTSKSGVAHAAFDNDMEALASLREFVSYLPLSNRGAWTAARRVKSSAHGDCGAGLCDAMLPPFHARRSRGLPRITARADTEAPLCPSLEQLVPTDPNLPYDMKLVIGEVLDKGVFFEVMPDFAKNIVVGFGRMEGHTVGQLSSRA